jgi:GNAT superfamily N-acetyltransferase
VDESTLTVVSADERWLDQLVAAYEWLFAPPGSKPPAWDPELARERLRDAFGSDDANVLVALREGRVVGFCTAYIDLLSVRFGLRCWVEDLAVDPAVRSEGVGSELLRRARNWAAEHGASHLELDSGEARTDAHRFYRREGANVTSVSFGWHGLGGKT